MKSDMYCGKCCKKRDKKKKEHHFVPRPGMKVVTPAGEGMIMSISRREQTVTVEVSPGNRVTVAWDEVMESAKVEKKMRETLRQDCLPDGVTTIWQDPGEFCFTTDAVFLAAFPHLGKKTKVLELGCGTGAVSLLLANQGCGTGAGVDINAHVVELLQRSIRDNHLEDRVEARALDLRNYKELPCDAMDLVAANPPYRIGGRKRQVGQAACHEVGTTLEDFFRAAAYALKTKGRFALVQLPERFTDAVKLGLTYNLELKRLQWVHSYVGPARLDLPGRIREGRTARTGGIAAPHHVQQGRQLQPTDTGLLRERRGRRTWKMKKVPCTCVPRPSATWRI